MFKNFTPFFTNLGKYKPDRVVSLLSSIFILSIVVVGFNQFSKQLASANCSTQSDIDGIISSKLAQEVTLSDIDTQITENNKNIVYLQESLTTNQANTNGISSQLSNYSDYYIAQIKKSVDTRYNTYLTYKNKSRKNLSKSALTMLDRQIASYKTTYENTLAQYNDTLAKRDALKQQLIDLNNEKTVIDAQVVSADTTTQQLNTSRATTQTELNNLIGSLETSYNNMCPTTESDCSDGLDNDKDGYFDCSDSDCASDTSCYVNTTTTVTTTTTTSTNTNTGCTDPCNSSCTNYNPSDSSCSTGVTTITTGCISNSDCGTNQVCSAGACVDGILTTNGGSSSGIEGVNDVDAVGRNVGKCCVCFWGVNKDSCTFEKSCEGKLKALKSQGICEKTAELPNPSANEDLYQTAARQVESICGDKKYGDKLEILQQDHSCEGYNNYCFDLSAAIVEEYKAKGTTMPSEIKVVDGGCYVAYWKDKFVAGAEPLRIYSEEYGIDFILQANQAVGAPYGTYKHESTCSAGITVNVCPVVTVKYPDCGGTCSFGGDEDVVDCKNSSGKIVKQKCVLESGCLTESASNPNNCAPVNPSGPCCPNGNWLSV